MSNAETQLAQGPIVEEEIPLTLVELCRACSATEEYVITWVFEGVLEPIGEAPQAWRFTGPCPCVARDSNGLGGSLTGLVGAGRARAARHLATVDQLVDRQGFDSVHKPAGTTLFGQSSGAEEEMKPLTAADTTRGIRLPFREFDHVCWRYRPVSVTGSP